MEKNKRVLIVTNSITDEEVAQIKQSIQDSQNDALSIKLSLVHVMPNLPICYHNIPSMGLMVEKYHHEAKESLQRVGKYLKIPQKDQWLISGKIRTEVLRLSNRLKADFILAGYQEIKRLHNSLMIKNIHHYATIKLVSQLESRE